MQTRILPAALLLTLLAALPASATDQLRIQDPQSWWRSGQGTIEQAVVTVRPVGVYVEYGLYLTLSARDLGFTHADTMEVILQFDLPQESIVRDSWLWIGDTIIRAEIMDKWTAESIYEEIVNRRRDPSILYKRSQTQYELRIFPLAGDESRKVKITMLVPARWSARAVSAPLPTGLVRTSKTAVPGLSVIAWPGGEWNNPRFPEVPAQSFSPSYDTTNGSHARADLSWSAMANPVRFAMDAPLRNGVYVNRHHDGDGGHYQLALLPSLALDLDSRRKTAILFDHSAGNSSVATAEVLSTVKSVLFSTMTHRDSFNLVFSQVPVRRASDAWLPADSATIDSVFASLGANPIASYSNLPALLADGIGFVGENGGQGHLLLVASSDQFGESSPANQLIDDLLGLMTTVVPIHVAEYQTQNFSYHWIGSRTYYGNEYFYTNVTRLTGGNYTPMRQGYPYSGSFLPFGTVIPSAFEAIGGFISSFDLHTKAQGGFCYSRINLGGAGTPVYIDRPILQVGRYYGDLPLTVEISGVYNSAVFNASIEAGDTTSGPVDSVVVESWAGNYVRSLEAQQQTNDVVNEIVRTSVGERVLSIYSAFLCLEPSRGGEVCYGCLDESGEVVEVQDSTAAADTASGLQAWPNPFNSATTIRFRLPADALGDGASLRIYDVLGREVRDFDLASVEPGSSSEVTWNGTDGNGATVNSGVYFVVFRSAAGVRTLKLMMLK